RVLPTAKGIPLWNLRRARDVIAGITRDSLLWPIETLWPSARRRAASKRCLFLQKIFPAISPRQFLSQYIFQVMAVRFSMRFLTDPALCPRFSLTITTPCERGTYTLPRPIAI